jgi:hypothetical protein
MPSQKSIDDNWEKAIDHRNPVAKGSTESPRNLRPLHREENREKSGKT